MLQRWLYPKIQQDRNDFIFMQDDAPPLFDHEIQQYVYGTILTFFYFYLWGSIKNIVYVPPVAATSHDLQDRIVTAEETNNFSIPVYYFAFHLFMEELFLGTVRKDKPLFACTMRQRPFLASSSQLSNQLWQVVERMKA
ncbi:hypothetical protein AVEN_178329-1 [Araneus ventricosus]|uniref:Uncharacterized protein n=1 Tax=Araneus ventricosus TaxID=182803 RepID=A0A4Y2BDS5_ARAVE|nr:hypothetical protein AVEN_178329-1 [Araneus ventricosus]